MVASMPNAAINSSMTSVSEWPRKFRPLLFQFRADGLMAINLAVVDDDVAAIRRDHRLVTGGRKIDDGKPAVDERDAGICVDPHAIVVRSAMLQRRVHRCGNVVKIVRRRARQTGQKPCNAAHMSLKTAVTNECHQ